MSNRKRIISINISNLLYKQFVANLNQLAFANRSSYTCVSNVHMCIEAHQNKEFADIVNGADLVTPDGMPLVKALKLLYGIQQDRVAGMDLLPDLLKESEIRNIKVFFYGGTQTMLDHTEAYCRQHYPQLQIAGLISPPFRQLRKEEELNYIDTINKSGAGFVFVALGCPKQEKWMASMKGRINACMVGIGGALPVMIGMQKRAPLWMQKASLEWLYRLMQEPKRLFKRYAITNTLFLVLLFKQWAKQGFKAVR